MYSRGKEALTAVPCTAGAPRKLTMSTWSRWPTLAPVTEIRCLHSSLYTRPRDKAIDSSTRTCVSRELPQCFSLSGRSPQFDKRLQNQLAHVSICLEPGVLGRYVALRLASTTMPNCPCLVVLLSIVCQNCTCREGQHKRHAEKQSLHLAP